MQALVHPDALHAAALTKGSYRLISTCCHDLCGPVAITGDADDLVYIVEEGSHTIKKYTGALDFLQVIGKKGCGRDEFHYPTDVLVSTTGFLFVTDRWNHRVQRLDKDGRFVGSFGSFGSGAAQFTEPCGIAEGINNTIIVADRGNGRLVFFDREGKYRGTCGLCGPSVGYYESSVFKNNFHYHQWMTTIHRCNTIENRFCEAQFRVGTLEYPEHLAVDNAGRIYVSDRNNGCVTVFNPEGSYETACSRQHRAVFPAEPGALGIHDDICLIADEDRGMVYAFSDEAHICYDFSPLSVAVSDFFFRAERRWLYIADAWHHAIYLFELL